MLTDFLRRTTKRGALRLVALPLLAVMASSATAAAVASFGEEPGDDPPAPITQKEIDQAIDKGVRFILSRQELDGSWRPDEHKYVSGQTGLCIYTLLKGGVKRSHPAVERGIEFLRAHPPRHTYGIACCILAVHAANPERYQAEIEEWTSVLLNCQAVGFTYGAGNNAEDLSLTQYGALGLRIAEQCGLSVSYKTWESLMDYAYRMHAKAGSFSYREGTAHTGSMTAAGIAILKIASDALEAQKKLTPRERRQIDETIEDGIAWLGEHMRVDENPDPGTEGGAGHKTRWALYYLYGLERVGSLTDRDLFGERDWYKEASEHLVRTQHDDGHWSTANGEAHPGTCFGVLVLKRATKPTSGSKPRGINAYGDDDPKRPASLRVTGDTPLTAWISSFGERSLKKFEWDEEIGKGLRVAKVEYVDTATDRVLATIQGNPEKPSKGNRFAAKFKFDKPGKFKLQAIVYVRPIDAEPDELLEVETQIIEVRIDGAMNAAMRDTTADLDRNALDATRCTSKASSTVNDGHKPDFITDGTHSYGWLSAPGDAQPWIEIEPDRPQRGDYVVVTPNLHRPDDRNHWGVPGRVLLKVNGKTQGEFDLVPDRFERTYLPLKKKVPVRLIRIEILQMREGTHAEHGKCAGFAEVELQLRPDLVKARKAAERAAKEAERAARRK